MKKTLLSLSIVLICSCTNVNKPLTDENKDKLNKEVKMDKLQIIETVNQFFISVDNRNWDKVRTIFNDTVLFDYTSMNGGQPSTLTSDQIIDSWKGLLPGFDKTHHQIGNYVIETNSNLAKLFCYVTATNYLDNKSKNNLLTVVGSYDIDLDVNDRSIKIIKLKFNLKFMDGNMDLPIMAQKRLLK